MTTTTEGPMDLPVMPCPFCGEADITVTEGESFRWRLARCNVCGAQAPDVRVQTCGSGVKEDWEAQAKVKAMAEWNKRYNAGGKPLSETKSD